MTNQPKPSALQFCEDAQREDRRHYDAPYSEIDELRDQLTYARDQFNSCCMAYWSRGNEIEMENWRSNMTYLERKIIDLRAHIQ